jgi:hypothetical protein
MKILKFLLFGILSIICIALIAAAFVPKEYTITLTETINRPKAEVYDYLKMFANQKEYSEWIKPDPNLKPVISGNDGTVGSSSSWNSDNNDVGEGSQTITAMTDDQIEIDIKFIRPMEGGAQVKNKIVAKDSTTTEVTVDFYTKDSYPLNLPSYLFGRPMIEQTEKKILANVKQILESRK